MEKLTEQERTVGKHYDENIRDFETERLLKHCPVEFAITQRYLERFVERDGVTTEVGVGGGHYSEWLARSGQSLYLRDLSQGMLHVAVARLDAAGLSERIIDVRCESATALGSIPTGICDVVLLLGPLYHLCAAVDRQRAVGEAARILKPAGVLFAAGVNRLALLRDAFHAEPEYTTERQAFHVQFLLDGNVDPLHVPPLGYGHLTTSTEFRALFADGFDELAFAGVESFTGARQSLPATATAQSAAVWLDLVERTAHTPDGIGMPDHFLYIGRRR